jgi:hypothetical protein
VQLCPSLGADGIQGEAVDAAVKPLESTSVSHLYKRFGRETGIASVHGGNESIVIVGDSHQSF